MFDSKGFNVGAFLANLVSFIIVLSTVIAVLDERHASSSDVEKLARIARDGQINLVEFQIAEVEQMMKRIKRREVPDKFDEEDLLDLTNRKAYLLRKMERLETVLDD